MHSSSVFSSWVDEKQASVAALGTLMSDRKLEQETVDNQFADYWAVTIRLSTLQMQLERVSNCFDTSERGNRDKQEAASEALVAVLDFLSSFPDMKPFIRPLFNLNEALVDVLANRRISPMLEPDAHHHRPLQSMQELRAQSAAVICFRLIMKSGTKKMEAAQKVAELFSSRKIAQGSGKPVSANTILEWDSKPNAFIQERLKNAFEGAAKLGVENFNHQKALEISRSILDGLNKQDIPPA